jgi:predicted helicase
MEDYKQLAGESELKGPQEDYARFIRFAQWKIDRTGKGIIGFITGSSYLDNPAFGGMRRSLMQSFDEIYILDLHGNIMRSPQTLFDICRGAAISFFVKTFLWKENLQSTGCRVYYSEIRGTREEKYNRLMNNNLFTIDREPVQSPGKWFKAVTIN